MSSGFAQSIAAVVGLGIVLGGCGGGGNGGGPSPPYVPPTPDAVTFDVEWAPTTTLIDEASGKAHLTGVAPGPGTMTYTFDAGASAIAALQPGDVVVLAGVAYRKVVAVTSTAAGIQLDTARTTLPEAMTSGTLAWGKTVNFADTATLQGAILSIGDRRVEMDEAFAAAPITYEGEIDGYDVSVTLTPSEGRLEAKAEVSKTIAGEKRFGVEGTASIEGFQGTGHAVIGEGGLLEFQAGANHVRGEAHLKAAAFNTGLSDELLDIPFSVDVPIELGPVPLLLKIKANINVRLILMLEESSAQAEVSFEFSSTQGFSLGGSSITSTSTLDEGDVHGFSGGSADAITAGMSTCLEFPRFELSMLGEFASVGLTQNNCAETFFQFQPACNEVTGSIHGIALANLGFFGVTLASASVDLYDRTDGTMAGMCD
jgi:hypothetical protein